MALLSYEAAVSKKASDIYEITGTIERFEDAREREEDNPGWPSKLVIVIVEEVISILVEYAPNDCPKNILVV